MEQATPKQIEFAKQLGIDNPEKYDKQALRGLIDVKLGERDKGKGKTQPEAPKAEKSYHLTPEQVRYNALDIALRRYPQLDTPGLLREAETIEKWFKE